MYDTLLKKTCCAFVSSRRTRKIRKYQNKKISWSGVHGNCTGKPLYCSIGCLCRHEKCVSYGHWRWRKANDGRRVINMALTRCRKSVAATTSRSLRHPVPHARRDRAYTGKQRACSNIVIRACDDTRAALHVTLIIIIAVIGHNVRSIFLYELLQRATHDDASRARK